MQKKNKYKEKYKVDTKINTKRTCGVTEEQGSEGATSKEPFSASWPIWWVGDQRPKRFYLMHKSCDGDGDDDQVMESCNPGLEIMENMENMENMILDQLKIGERQVM